VEARLTSQNLREQVLRLPGPKLTVAGSPFSSLHLCEGQLLPLQKMMHRMAPQVHYPNRSMQPFVPAIGEFHFSRLH